VSWTLSIIEVGVIPAVPLAAHVPGAPPGELISPPCYCYVVVDGSKIVVVDTGADAPSAFAAGLGIEGDTRFLLDQGLRACDITPGDVTLIVHTHLHYDHVGNDLRFSNAEVVVQRSELSWAVGPKAGGYYVETAALLDALGPRVRPVEGEVELLRGLRVIWTGGHTPGHQSVVLSRPSGDVCICGDVVPLHVNTEVVGSSCPWTDDAERFLATARQAKWEMIPSHDPALRLHPSYVAPHP
jgi:glyoxylase-like metal-dependent hydrolase (beta-lactamase superfamily II)